MAERRTTLFMKNQSVAALSLTLTGSGGVVALGAGSIPGLARMFAAGRFQPVMRESHGETNEAINSFCEHTVKSIGNGWRLVYHGKPNFG
jgi:hypothetical protein